MVISFQLFRQRPLVGNGPGSFSVLGTPGAHEDYYIETGADLTRMYDPSILTTVLNDTGLLGSAAFLVLIAAYFDYVRRQSRRMGERVWRNTASAAHCAFVGLFASFFFTHYFWMPFTWLFLAIVVTLHEFGPEGSRENLGLAAPDSEGKENGHSPSIFRRHAAR
jgi:O-antigen ligase